MSIEQIELQAKLLDYFLGSNKSNINQYVRLGDLGYSPLRPLVNWRHSASLCPISFIVGDLERVSRGPLF